MPIGLPFPEPDHPPHDALEVALRSLDYYRSVAVAKVRSLSDDARTVSQVPSGWTSLGLLDHLLHMERRWLEWRFEGTDVEDPHGDEVDGAWRAMPDRSFEELARGLDAQGRRTREVVARHRADEVGVDSDRWRGGRPARLDRVLWHVVQEYARHLGHLDVVVELAGGDVGE